jgi:hypothetical protein
VVYHYISSPLVAQLVSFLTDLDAYLSTGNLPESGLKPRS